MKGIVFTEFLDLVDSYFGEMVTEEIISKSNLESGGAYTAVGTYDYREMLTLAEQLSQHTDQPVPDLMRTFGAYLFGRFSTLYPVFLNNLTSSLEFVATIEDHIHVEVRKLYADTQLPQLVSKQEDGSVTLTYASTRPFADFAEGLLLGCIEHFDHDATLTRNDLNQLGTNTEFTLTAKADQAMA